MKGIIFILTLLVSLTGYSQYKPNTMQFQKLASYKPGIYFSAVTGKDSLSIPHLKHIDSLLRKVARDTALAHAGNGIYSNDGVLSSNRHVSGGVSGYTLQIDSSTSISLFSGLEYIASGIGSFIQMSDSVMSIGSSSATDFTSFIFSPTRIKFTAADGAGNAGDVWTNTGSGYGHWATPPLIASGTWSPTLTDGTNSSGASVSAGRYTRVGNIVNFSLTFTTTTSSGASATTVTATLPVASDFTTTSQASGTNSGLRGSVSSTTGDLLSIDWTSNTGGSETITITGQYIIL